MCSGNPVREKSRDESVADVWEESVQHVKSFVTGGDTAAEVEFKWMLTRTLAKCKRECADAVWKQRPRSIPEGVAAIREWEYKYGPAAKVFMRKPEVFFDKKLNFPPVAQVKGEPEKSLAQGMDKCQASALTGCRAALKEQNKHVYVVVYV